jgi:hypothetical protein
VGHGGWYSLLFLSHNLTEPQYADGHLGALATGQPGPGQHQSPPQPARQSVGTGQRRPANKGPGERQARQTRRRAYPEVWTGPRTIRHRAIAGFNEKLINFQAIIVWQMYLLFKRLVLIFQLVLFPCEGFKYYFHNSSCLQNALKLCLNKTK